MVSRLLGQLLVTSLLISSCATNFAQKYAGDRSVASENVQASCTSLAARIIGKSSIKSSDLNDEQRLALSKLLTDLSTLDPKVVAANSLPNMQQIEELIALRNRFHALSNQIDFTGVESIIDESPELKNVLENFKARVSSSLRDPTKKKYLGGEYKLKSYYQNIFEEINSSLPLKYRIPKIKIPLDLDATILNKQAEKILTNHIATYTKAFPSTGFKTFKDYQTFLRANQNQIGEELLDNIEKEKFEIAMAAPSGVRRGIQISGFLNQYVTNTSGGTLDHSLRLQAEAALLGVPSETYTEIRNEIKPKYAYLAPPLDSKIEGFDASLYGDDRYIFKKDKIKKRITFAKGDSLVVGTYNINFPKAEKAVAMNQWDSMFIPWEYRSLLVPALEKQYKIGYLLSDKIDPQTFKPLNFQETINFGDVPYVEAQLWGPVDLDDVEKFIFHEQEPSGEFLKALLSKKIQIYDARDGKRPTPWHPNSN